MCNFNQSTNSFRCQTYTNISPGDEIFIKSSDGNSIEREDIEVKIDPSINLSAVRIISDVGRSVGEIDKYNHMIKKRTDNPNIFVAILKENETMWQYGMINTNNQSTISVDEIDLNFQASLSQMEAPPSTGWTFTLGGVQEFNNESRLFILEKYSSSNPPDNFINIDEPNLLGLPLESFTKYYSWISLGHPDENRGVFKLQIGEPITSFSPKPLAYEVLQNDDEHLKITTTDDYSYFYAEWQKQADLGNGETGYGYWKVFGNFQTDFEIPQLPEFAVGVLPQALNDVDLSLWFVHGNTDNRFADYNSFLQKFLYDEISSVFLESFVGHDFEENLSIESTYLDF